MMLTIPETGLSEVTRAWSGQGRLWDALAMAEPEDDALSERQWSARDVQRRAHRVLFQELMPRLSRWPTTLRGWLEALPAEAFSDRVITLSPTSGTQWRETRRFGWPPSAFVAKVKRRQAASLLVTTLKWSITQLLNVAKDARQVVENIDAPVRRQLDALTELSNVPALHDVSDEMPTRGEIAEVRAEGYPWNGVADVADTLRRLNESSLTDLARRIIMPDEGLRWRLFHLSVLGEVLLALRGMGSAVTSERPLSSAATNGPSYVVRDGQGVMWHLWFEAAGIWSFNKMRSPYSEAASGVGGESHPLGADLMLIRPGRRALILECKFSADTSVVARGGYEQALAYAVEARTHLASEVSAAVIGPREVVQDLGVARTAVGTVCVASPEHIRLLVERCLSSEPESEEFWAGPRRAISTAG